MCRPNLLSRVMGFIFVTACAHGVAQIEPSLGESSRVMACPYTCVSSRDSGMAANWSEISTIKLTNIDSSTDARLHFIDGLENVVAVHLSTSIKRILGTYDVDEINVCRTLYESGLPVPRTGTVVVFSDLAGASRRRVYGWSTTYIGKFSSDDDEPHDGTVRGMAQTECRLAPGAPPIDTAGLPDIDLVYIRNSEEINN